MKKTSTIILLLVGILVLWLIRGKPSDKNAASKEKSQPRATLTQKTPLLSMGQLVSEATATKRNVSIRRYSEDILLEALAADADLKTFKMLSDKAIRTSDEQREYLRLLSEEARLQASKEELLSLDPSQEGELRRIVQVKFLANSYLWKENPVRDLAHQVLLDVLLHDFSDDAPPLSVLKSLYGDKIELYQYLLMSDPDEAEKIRVMTKGTRLERVLEVAGGMIGKHLPAGE